MKILKAIRLIAVGGLFFLACMHCSDHNDLMSKLVIAVTFLALLPDFFKFIKTNE